MPHLAPSLPLQWSYQKIADDMTGPASWVNNYPSCGTASKEQSPIDVPGEGDTETLPHPLALKCEDVTSVLATNNQYSVAYTPTTQDGSPACTLTLPSRIAGNAVVSTEPTAYRLLHWHIHAPSEHTIQGKQADLEVHFVHSSASGEKAVVGVLFELGEASPWLARLLAHPVPQARIPQTQLAAHYNQDVTPTTTNASLTSFSVASLITAGGGLASVGYVRYGGSLTTPPCSEGVQWNLLTEVQTVSVEQLQSFKDALGFDSEFITTARPVQPVGVRRVFGYHGWREEPRYVGSPSRPLFTLTTMAPALAGIFAVLFVFLIKRRCLQFCKSEWRGKGKDKVSDAGDAEHFPSIEMGSSVGSDSEK